MSELGNDIGLRERSPVYLRMKNERVGIFLGDFVVHVTIQLYFNWLIAVATYGFYGH